MNRGDAIPDVNVDQFTGTLRSDHDSDHDLLERLEPEVQDWWIERFGRYVPENGGLFTPPQREAIPRILSGDNTLICAPTGSGKCVTPGTPIVVESDGRVTVQNARELLARRGTKLATVDDEGSLFATDFETLSLNRTSGSIDRRSSLLYTEPYEGPIHRLTTAAGHEIECTPAHPVLVDTADGPEWRSAEAVSLGDRVGVPARLDLPEHRIETASSAAIETLRAETVSMSVRPGSHRPRMVSTIADGSTHNTDRDPARTADRARAPPSTITAEFRDGTRVLFRCPSHVDKSLGWVCGRLVGRDHRRSAPSDPSDFAERVGSALELAVVDSSGDRSAEAVVKRLLSGPLGSFLETLLRIDETGHLPDWVLNAPREVKRSVLEGIVDATPADDGDRTRTVRLREPIDVERLVYLCLAFGIATGRPRAPNRSVAGSDDGSQPAGNRLRIPDRAIGRLDCRSPERSGASPDTMRDPYRNVRWVDVVGRDTRAYAGRVIDLTVPGHANFIGGAGAMFLHNTLASFSVILNDLLRRSKQDSLENSVYCLYISPLKSLANDIHRNLEVPLSGISERREGNGGDVDIRHAIRHGDTGRSARRNMLDETPHILNTTPETLAILLNSPKFREKLRTVSYVIVDEIHSLADNKRGTHLAVSLERLERLLDRSPVRIGCSATVEPLETMAEFLVGRASPDGPPRPYEIVDTRFVRDYDIELCSPAADLIDTPPWIVQDRFYTRLHELIQRHTNTLVFTNTRSGSERVLYNLRERFAEYYDESNSGCHHGSLAEGQRKRVEEGLKSGSLDVVTTSTSLELGIDMPHVDLVVQVGSPKSVAALLQRIGRAGHRLGRTVTGRVIALDRDELVECAVMLERAASGFVDRVFIPENAHDVAAQHVYGMAINNVLPEHAVKGTIRRAYPYRNYSDEMWESLMRYLTADYDGLEDRNVYAKVWRDTNDPPDGEHHYEEYEVGQPLIGRRGRLARPIYLTNVGTIPDSFTCQVFTRAEDDWVGDLDEGYLDTLDPGDVFVLGGNRFEFRYRRGSKVYADRTDERPTVPSWFSERLPLSYDMGRSVLQFQTDLIERYADGGSAAVRDWLRGFPIDENSVRAIARMFDQQLRYAGPESVSTERRLAIEEELDRERYKRRYYVHSNFGRRVNEGFSRLIAHLCAQSANAGVQVAVADNGFTLVMPMNQKLEVERVISSIDPDEIRDLLRESLRDTDLLQRYFRINATRSLLILKRYKGYEKTAGEQQVSSEMLLGFAEGLDDFAVIEETYREILEDKLAVDALSDILSAIADGSMNVTVNRVSSPSPRAFGLATLSASDVVLAKDESAALQSFHDRVLSAIGEPDDP